MFIKLILPHPLFPLAAILVTTDFIENLFASEFKNDSIQRWIYFSSGVGRFVFCVRVFQHYGGVLCCNVVDFSVNLLYFFCRKTTPTAARNNNKN